MTRIPTNEHIFQALLPSGSSAGASPTASVLLTDPPISVTRLANGAIIEGIVLGSTADGLTQVRTRHGVLSLRPQHAYPEQSRLVLELQVSGSQLRVIVLSVQPPAAGTMGTGPPVTIVGPPASIARLPSGATLEGVLIGSNAQGHAQVRTEHGILTLSGKIPIPVGGRVSLQLVSTGATVRAVVLPGQAPSAEAANAAASLARAGGAESVSRPAAAPSQPASALAREWPALAEAIEAIQGAAGAAPQALQAVLPQAGPNLPATLLFFVAALRRGEIGGWLGRLPVEALAAAGRRDLVDRLGDDFAHLSRLAYEGKSDDWRGIFIPFYDGERVQQIQLFLRRRKQRQREGEDEQPTTRFIFQFDLSRLGPMQLDGLAAPGRLDLIVRSQRALPREITNRATELFSAARADLKLAGDIGFQTVSEFPVAPLEEVLGQDDGLIV